MALFGKKSEEKKEQVKAAGEGARAAASVRSSEPTDLSGVLLSPRITEKATDATARGVYVFDIAPRANKKLVAAAVKKIYKVTPTKVRIARTPHKVMRNPRTGMYGTTTAGRKAYVYLKEGESISIM